MPKTASQLLMERETRVVDRPVPRSLFDEPLPPDSWQMRGDQFLLRAERDHYFHYRKGQGVAVERGAGADVREEALWLNGSVYSAVASINGLLPVHASAIAFDGGVFAFTGPASAGKSTLVAGLGGLGLPMFCDDTLVLDLTEPKAITCLPGHKRLKLRDDAIALTGAAREEKVAPTIDKYFASPSSGDVGEVLPLYQLIFLEVGAHPAIKPITGAEKMLRLQDEHQTAQLFAIARRFDRAGHFAHLARLASQIKMASFVRPIDSGAFGEGIEFMHRYINRNAR